MIKTIGQLIIICITIMPVLAQTIPASTTTIEQSSRKIQKDGFLIEWSLQNSRVWSRDHQVTWDAVNTAEGLAGYIRFGQLHSNGRWQIHAYIKNGMLFEWLLDSTGTGGPTYAVDRKVAAGTSTGTLEFLLPWNSIALQPDSSYQIAFTALSPTGDTLVPLYIAGTRKTAIKKGTWSAVNFQAGAIGILLVVFIILQMRIKRKKRRTGSLRQ